MPTRRELKPFTAGQLEAVCQVLADTNEGLTGSEIGPYPWTSASVGCGLSQYEVEAFVQRIG